MPLISILTPTYNRGKLLLPLYESLKKYHITTLINNAGFGNYDKVESQDLEKIITLIHLNIEALTILSTLYVRDYKDCKGISTGDWCLCFGRKIH